jgi:hypothetical protein
MKKKSVSMRLSDDHLDFIRQQGSTPGDGLSNILDRYVNKGDPSDLTAIVAAVSRHMLRGKSSSQPVRPTSVYVDPYRLDALRVSLANTYIPFEGVIRILIEDCMFDTQNNT